MKTVAILLATVLLSSGCGSVYSLVNEPLPYGGVYTDWEVMQAGCSYVFTSQTTDPINGMCTWLFFPCLIDTPLSLVADTVALPYTGVIAARKSRK
jgi:uncharacterized protein YceK